MYVLRVKADEEVEMMFESAKAFFKCFRHLKLNSKLEEWKGKVSQVRIARAENMDRPHSRARAIVCVCLCV